MDEKYMDWLKQMMGVGTGLYGSAGVAPPSQGAPQAQQTQGAFGYGNPYSPGAPAQQSPYFEGYQNMSRGF